MVISKRYLRIIIGIVIPIIIMSILNILDAIILKKTVNLASIIFFLLYTPVILFIPLLIYSLLMDLIIIPVFYNKFWLILLFSVTYATVLSLLPYFIGGGKLDSVDMQMIHFIFKAIIDALIVGYILKSIYPQNGVSRHLK